VSAHDRDYDGFSAKFVFRQAKLGGFEKDLGLVGDQFNTAVSILNVG